MAISLPNPDALDVWGTQLNTAINTVEGEAQTLKTRVDNIVATGVGSNVVTTDKLGVTVATLDGGGWVPARQLANVTPTLVGAAPASHQHNLSDIPQAQLALDFSPAWAAFNTTTNKWPRRIDVTNSQTRVVIWAGNATPPSDAIVGVDLYYGPRTAGRIIVGAGSDPTPTPTPDVNGITLFAPTVTVNGSLYNISANMTNSSTARTIAYTQLIVRGPNGENADTGYLYNRSFTASEAVTLTGSGSATVTGTWSVRIGYNITGSSGDPYWISGPATNFTIATTGGGTTPPVGGGAGRTIPLIGRSGLTWNSGVFRNAGDLTSANQFATFRNRPLDSIMYFPGRATWNDISYKRSDLTTWPGYRIISLPSQPTTGDPTLAANQNSVGAGATSVAFWTQYGKDLASMGWNDGRTILRLNWEGNGNWYAHAWYYQGAAQYVATYKAVVNAIRLNAPKTLFNMTMNKGNKLDATVWQTDIMNPLINHVDIVGVDWYDDYPNQSNTSGFNSALALDPGPTSVATWCRANGKMMWIDEWSLSHRPDAGSAAGGDDPFYINQMYLWLAANADVVAGETYFEDNGTNGQNGTLMLQSNGTQLNPNGTAAYIATNRFGK